MCIGALFMGYGVNDSLINGLMCLLKYCYVPSTKRMGCTLYAQIALKKQKQGQHARKLTAGCRTIKNHSFSYVCICVDNSQLDSLSVD